MCILYVCEDAQLVHQGQGEGQGQGGEGQGLRDDRGKTETQQQALEDVGPSELPTAASTVREQRTPRQQVRLRVSTKCGEGLQNEEEAVKRSAWGSGIAA